MANLFICPTGTRIDLRTAFNRVEKGNNVRIWLLSFHIYFNEFLDNIYFINSMFYFTLDYTFDVGISDEFYFKFDCVLRCKCYVNNANIANNSVSDFGWH